VLSQDEGSASFDGMPRSARETGFVDQVLPPAQMPQALTDHVCGIDVPTLAESLGNHARPLGVTAAFRFLQESYGIDFAHYKPSTVMRRVERRVQLSRAPSFEAYLERLAGDREELDALFSDLLIGVTRFFRDQAAFEQLERLVVPGLVERTPEDEEIRVWVAGCATGEEAYTIAILLQEAIQRSGVHRRLRVLATDVHRGSLDFASRGLYEADKVSDLRPELLARYFDKHGGSYQVSPELRQLLVFAAHNVVKDAPFTRIDLVSCRNMLIYLQPAAQKKALGLFHFALKRHGVMFLGPSENIGTLSDDFETIDAHWRIYRKQRDVRLASTVGISAPRTRLHGPDGNTAASYSLGQVIGVYDALLDEHLPPSLLVNERRELVHAFAGASRYLRMRDGRPSLDVFDVLAPDLKVAVAGALQRALKEGSTVVYKGLRLSVGGEERMHQLTVKPVVMPGAPLEHLLVSIEQLDQPASLTLPESEMDLSQVSRDQLGSLESELRRTKENLQATIEELETSNEELQAANEELVAANEELQSTNEELQSVNEELYTVNSEYQKKIAELTQVTNDMDNLLASIEVGTIFLDRELCIRKFTPRVAEAFNLLPRDIGRPIAAFSNNLQHPDLMRDLERVLQSHEPLECELRDRAGGWQFLRILPYRARGSVDGVVLTLVDIDGLKQAEDAVFRERYLLNSLMESVPDLIYFKDASGRFVRVNNAMAKRLGLAEPALAAGKSAADLRPEAQSLAFELVDQDVLAGEVQTHREEQLGGENGPWFVSTRQPLRDAEGNLVGVMGVARDVTERKRAEQEIRLAVRRRDEFLATLSHELRNPLAAIVNAAVVMGQRNTEQGSSEAALQVIERQTRQMARLLEDLLEVSRITQNKIELRRQIMDARSVVRDAVAVSQERVAARQLTLRVELDEEPVLLDVDAARLQQVVVNLLDNACKYNLAGRSVIVRLRKGPSDALLTVSDDGIGIAPEVMRTIFDPFVQGATTLDRTGGGIGVGLAVVRSLVEMHGGTVTAHSDGLGHGSVFSVRLPLPDLEACAKSEPKPPASLLRGRRVVLIEDNEDSREMLQLLLETAGYEVFAASDGESGLALIRSKRPDTAIVDIGLPCIDGFEIARRLRAEDANAGLRLVALTGYGQAADQKAARDAGFDEHVVKPLDPEQIARLLQNAH